MLMTIYYLKKTPKISNKAVLIHFKMENITLSMNFSCSGPEATKTPAKLHFRQTSRYMCGEGKNLKQIYKRVN